MKNELITSETDLCVCGAPRSCECRCPEIVAEFEKNMPCEEESYDVAELFRVLGDPTRVKILFALCLREMAVNEISEALDMTQSAISHQLRVLKQGRLVKYRREGKTVYYSIADHHVKTILSMGIEHVAE
ncbi:MAG: metalloregulator ArsR/SmtB family transcription factor [Oscillospiraceae bacterium]